jgi:hypothetical protein
MVTARGKAARSDPSALWFQLAERMPLTSKDLCEEQAGLLFLIAVAAGENDPDGFVADMLDAIGWKHRDRTPITTSSAAHKRGTPVTCCGGSGCWRRTVESRSQSVSHRKRWRSPASRCGRGHPPRNRHHGRDPRWITAISAFRGAPEHPGARAAR